MSMAVSVDVANVKKSLIADACIQQEQVNKDKTSLLSGSTDSLSLVRLLLFEYFKVVHVEQSLRMVRW
jgi:hypothetical protein